MNKQQKKQQKKLARRKAWQKKYNYLRKTLNLSFVAAVKVMDKRK